MRCIHPDKGIVPFWSPGSAGPVLGVGWGHATPCQPGLQTPCWVLNQVPLEILMMKSQRPPPASVPPGTAAPTQSAARGSGFPARPLQSPPALDRRYRHRETLIRARTGTRVLSGRGAGGLFGACTWPRAMASCSLAGHASITPMSIPGNELALKRDPVYGPGRHEATEAQRAAVWACVHVCMCAWVHVCRVENPHNPTL